jgi:hypothetical protein
MIADSKDEAQAQGLKMIEQTKAAIESEKMQLWLNETTSFYFVIE